MPSPARTVALVAAVTSALAVVAAAATARAQDRPPSRMACGAYEAVPSGVDAAGRPTRLSIQKGGRLLRTISDGAITRVECADMNGDGTNELFVTSHSGGDRCCETLHVWSLGSAPTRTLEYGSGGAVGFELRDLNGDDLRELVVGDDTFSDFDDLSAASSPDRLPLVACPTAVGFEDCTGRFPDLLRSWLTRYVERLKAPGVEAKDAEGAALGVLALSVLLGEESAGIDSVRMAGADDDVMAWLERARPKVRAWAKTRGKRLQKR